MINFLSNFIVRLKNAILIKKNYLYLNYTNKIEKILQILTTENFILGYKIYKNPLINKKYFKIFLKYNGSWYKYSSLHFFKQISNSAHLKYSSYKKFTNIIGFFKYKFGFAILSTSFGYINHMKSLKYRLGGKIYCYIY